MKRTRLTAVIGALVALGCSSAATVDRYAFAPDAGPLTYHRTEHSEISVDTPMGAQESSDSSKATIEIDIQDGQRMTARYLSLEVWNSQLGHRDGEGLVGELITGSIEPNGQITVVSKPEIPDGLVQLTDPIALLADMLPPLPGDDAEEWSVEREYSVVTGLDMEYRFVGTAGFVGDTTWNGQTVRVIHSEGTFDIVGEGTPHGSPGKLEIVVSGPSWTSYYWDPARGVMLGATWESKGVGDVAVVGMGMTFSATFLTSGSIELAP